MTEYMFFIAPVCALAALIFAYISARRIMKEPEGPDVIKKIASAIRSGANAYLKRQYRGVIAFFAVMFIILIVMAIFGFLTPFVPFAFVTGGFFSGLSGFIGMRIATYANSRTAYACGKSLNKGLKIAFSSGSVMGFTVVGLGLLDLSIWYILLKYVFYGGLCVMPGSAVLADSAQIQLITSAMLTFGMGASSMALFARVGGGIFTKAADVGADLVGKIEAGIPEDDPRNPAVIADNVGDNVGDIAGMGADLYESYVGSIVASMSLAVAAGYGFSGAAVPMIMAAVGILASLIGAFFVHSGEKTNQKVLLAALRRGTYISSGITAIAAFPIIYFVMDCASNPERLGIYAAVLSGLLAGVVIGFFTEYYTSDTYRPTKQLANSTKTGPATVVISGISLGFRSTAIPVIVICISVLISYFMSGGFISFERGLFGVGISAVGILATLGITLATDAYGPVADNAGGIAEMAQMDAKVRERTDALDSLGNTTAATGKGFAIGSAGLTALALIASYTDKVKILGAGELLNLNITNPPVLVGLFIGAMLTFLFSSMTMSAVGRAAQSIVIEVRRQFRQITGLMEGTAQPDYAACVDICTKNAQKEMLAPMLLATAAPIITGLILGVNGVIGLLCGATVTGFMLAIAMANSGGAWDNAKKFIEGGNLGGKGSDAHKAAVVGDTVGDPFKDTSGPSINILIKLLSMVAIVFCGLIISFHLL